MATFLDHTRITARDPIKSFYYVCGVEPVLREQALDQIRAKVDPRPQDVELLSAAEHSPAYIWEAILTHVETAPRRFICVRDAERLADWERFFDYTDLLQARAAPAATVVFLAAAKDFGERSGVCTRGHDAMEIVTSQRKQVRQCATCASIKQKISSIRALQYVECSTPGEPIACKLVHGSMADAWPGWLICSRKDAVRILEAAGWDLSVAWDLCRKLQITGAPPNERVLQVLVHRSTPESFVDNLCSLHKAKAATLAHALSAEEIRRALGQLGRRVDVLSRIHRALKRNDNSQALAQQLNMHYKIIESWKKDARFYDAERAQRVHLALARTDAVVQRGNDVGALELLTLMW